MGRKGIENIGIMTTVPKEIQARQIGHFTKADPAYSEGVAKGLGLPLPEPS